MSMSEVIQDVTKWLAWGGSGLGILTILAYLLNWGIKFRLTGTTIFTLLLSFLNAPSMLFEMFPFIFLITTQLFFIKLFQNKEIEIFKYSGLKNSKILSIISGTCFVLGILIITLFYSLSSNLKNIYLEIKNEYSTDNKYLAVITNNGLWIKDFVGKEIRLVNASKIDQNFLIDVIISEFEENFVLKRNIKSNKIDIKDYGWIIYNPKIYIDGNTDTKDFEIINSNFNYQNKQISFPERLEKAYTKGDLLDYFGYYSNENIIKSPQYWAGCIFIKKTDKSINFINQWLEVFDKNFDLIDDSISKINNYSDFVENRHDQSVYSLLCKRYKLKSFSAYECDWACLDNKRTWEHNKYSPILAKRDLKYSIFRRFLNRQKKTYGRLKKRLLEKINDNEKKI